MNDEKDTCFWLHQSALDIELSLNKMTNYFVKRTFCYLQQLVLKDARSHPIQASCNKKSTESFQSIQNMNDERNTCLWLTNQRLILLSVKIMTAIKINAKVINNHILIHQFI